MKKISLIIFLAAIFLFSFTLFVLAQPNITGSVVKIYTVYNEPNYYRPWQMMGQESYGGSGCIIEGNRILTNAHVIADTTFIQVKRAGEAKKYTAHVEIVAHECDLAILKVNDASFFTGAMPVEIGGLPEIGDTVATFGFPEGGEELAFTEGVVSRIEINEYTHSKAMLLCCQIDAPINNGSSGGPVIKDNKLVGVSFQAAEGENISYMVSVPVINHFLKDIEDGKYDGIPGLGISWQKMENPDIRMFCKMGDEYSGVLVNRIYPTSPLKGKLKKGDVILSIDGADIANDGTVRFRENERTLFNYIVQNKYLGETADFKILRDGKTFKLKEKLTIPVNSWRLIPHDQYDIAPMYYIVGGLVFQKLTKDYLSVRLKDEYYSSLVLNLYPYYYAGEPTEDRREIVVLASVLADDINIGYQDLGDIVISYANGKKIASMDDLIAAVEKNQKEYHVFVDDQGKQIVIDKKKTKERDELILGKYKVPSDRSEDLKSIKR